MNSKYKSGQIMKDPLKEVTNKNICKHLHLVPLEIGFARKTYPDGFKEDPYYNFAISMVGANIIRVKSYLCLDCHMEIKAPDPGMVKKDKLKIFKETPNDNS